MLVGQFELIGLTRRQIVAEMQSPYRAIGCWLADRRPVERPQEIVGPALRGRFQLFANQRRHDVAEARRRFTQPFDQRRAGQDGDLAGLGPRAGLAQRDAETTIGKRTGRNSVQAFLLSRARVKPPCERVVASESEPARKRALNAGQ